MTLTFPRDLVFEVWLGRWVEVTALPIGRGLRQEDPVSLSWGSAAEQGKVPPSTVEAVLNNAGGHWTPGNPMSDYFDYLQGRNVPTRLSLRVSRDTFTNRTVALGWGFSDTGDGWNPSGVSGLSVGSGVGVHSVGAGPAFALTYLGDAYPDCLNAITVSFLAAGDVTGGAVEPGNLVQRYQPSGTFAGEHYILRVSVSAAEVVTIAIEHSSLGTLAGPVATGLSHAAGRSFRSAFYAEGQTLRGKVWDAANDEPLGWQIGVHHERLTGGFPGVRSGVAAGNTNAKPIDFSYDNWELRLVRHTGELATLKPTWDESHRIKKAAFKCADVTQRLGRPQRPSLSSAPRRYLGSNLEFTTTDHWPLDEPATAPAKGLSAVAGRVPATFQREFDGVQDRGAVTWGETDQVMTSVPGFSTLNNGGQLTCTVTNTALGSSASVMWAMRLTPDAGGKVFVHTAVTSQFVFFFYTDGTYELFGNPGSASLATGVLAPNGLAGFWCTMGLTIFNNGGSNIGYHLNVNGTALGVGSWAGGPYSAPRSVVLYVPQPTDGGQGDGAFSSLFVTSSRFDTFSSGLPNGTRASRAIMGWRGENSGLRAFRLCAEEAVPFDYWNDLGQTRPMGAQTPAPLLDQLQDCADADGAALYAPRYSPGVAFRGRRAMAARAADATLAYSSGHVARELAPSADDRPTANLVRAERVDGGFLIVEQTTGPMNTKDPGSGTPPDPEAVGRSPAEARANVESDAQLGDLGGWVRALGTTPEVRFPRVTVNLRARELTLGVDPTAPARALMNLHPVGDRLVVTGLGAADVYRDLDQMVRGGKETFRSVYEHSLTLNTAPYEKWRAGIFGDAASRYDGAVTTLDAQLAAGVTGGRAVTTSAGMPWTVAAGAYPLDVLIGGERCTVSGVTGSGLAAQTMTISVRNVNSLPPVGGKTHPAGTRVYLFQPVYYS